MHLLLTITGKGVTFRHLVIVQGRLLPEGERGFFKIIFSQWKTLVGRKDWGLERFIIWLATASYSGYFPFAPGTAGTVVGVLVYFLFSPYPTPIYLLSTVTTFFLAWWASEKAETIFKEKDSPRIVIDEVVGYLITMALLPPSIPTAIGGFLFFRVFDIMKIPPAGFVHRQMKGGLAVVLDDAIAGIYANLLLQSIIWYYPDFLHLGRWVLGPN